MKVCLVFSFCAIVLSGAEVGIWKWFAFFADLGMSLAPERLQKRSDRLVIVTVIVTVIVKFAGSGNSDR